MELSAYPLCPLSLHPPSPWITKLNIETIPAWAFIVRENKCLSLGSIHLNVKHIRTMLKRSCRIQSFTFGKNKGSESDLKDLQAAEDVRWIRKVKVWSQVCLSWPMGGKGRLCFSGCIRFRFSDHNKLNNSTLPFEPPSMETRTQVRCKSHDWFASSSLTPAR